jgi:NAD(P)-dependent dehydrogenase (short-subunit alcohol dehydrogenase family)
MSLTNKTIVIIGGSSGIGLATANAALTNHADVIITGRSRDRLDSAVRELGAHVRAIALDSTDEAGTRAMFNDIAHVDHIFVSAGGVTPDKALSVDVAAMRPAIDVRLWGAIYAAKYARPRMTAGGSITFMSGTSAFRPLLGAAVGTASCAAVEGLARALAVDFAPIRVNAIRPGIIDTPLIDSFMGGENKAANVSNYTKRIPLKRMGRPEEVADAVLFLMKNEYMNGTTLVIDGAASLV